VIGRTLARHERDRHYLNPLVADEGRRAIEYLRQVIERAPSFAPAHPGLARRLVWLDGLGRERIQREAKVARCARPSGHRK
jgi:hypothetical protein